MYQNVLKGVYLKEAIYSKYVTVKNCYCYMNIAFNIYAYFIRYVCFIHYFVNMLGQLFFAKYYSISDYYIICKVIVASSLFTVLG